MSELQDITFVDVPIDAIAYILGAVTSESNNLRRVQIHLHEDEGQNFWSEHKEGIETNGWFQAVDDLLSKGVRQKGKIKVRVFGCKGQLRVYSRDGNWNFRAVDSCKHMFPNLFSLGALTNSLRGFGGRAHDKIMA